MMTHGSWLAPTAVFVLLLTSLLAVVAAFLNPRRASANRLTTPGKRIAAGRSGLARGSIELAGLPGWLLEWQLRRTRETVTNNPAIQRLRTMLAHAGYSGLDKLVIFRALQVAAILGLALLAMLAAIATAHAALLSAIAGAAAGYLIPVRTLRRMVRRRQIRIARELPGTLDLLVVCLEAGVSLMESIRIVAREALRQGRVIGAELTIVAGELNAGLPLEDGLRQLGERTGVDDLKSLAALLIQSERMGSRLGPALRASAEALTTRRRMRAEEQAQKSTIKMLVPLVLLILPAMMIIILGPAVLQVLALLRS